jgi:hypothetical protein
MPVALSISPPGGTHLSFFRVCVPSLSSSLILVLDRGQRTHPQISDRFTVPVHNPWTVTGFSTGQITGAAAAWVASVAVVAADVSASGVAGQGRGLPTQPAFEILS